MWTTSPPSPKLWITPSPLLSPLQPLIALAPNTARSPFAQVTFSVNALLSGNVQVAVPHGISFRKCVATRLISNKCVVAGGWRLAISYRSAEPLSRQPGGLSVGEVSSCAAKDARSASALAKSYVRKQQAASPLLTCVIMLRLVQLISHIHLTFPKPNPTHVDAGRECGVGMFHFRT